MVSVGVTRGTAENAFPAAPLDEEATISQRNYSKLLHGTRKLFDKVTLPADAKPGEPATSMTNEAVQVASIIESSVESVPGGDHRLCLFNASLISSVKKETSGHTISPHMSASLLTLARYTDPDQVTQGLSPHPLLVAHDHAAAATSWQV